MVQIKIESLGKESVWENIENYQQINNETNIEQETIPQYQWTDHHHLVITNLQTIKMDIRCITKSTTMEGSSEQEFSSHRLNSFQAVGKSFIIN